MKRTTLGIIVPCLVVLLMGADNQEARFQNLGSKIMCTCSCAQMLLKCNHVGCPNSASMIRELRTGVQNSSNDEEILDGFRQNWGAIAVVQPKTHGFELLAWFLPPTGAVLGILLVLLVIRTWKMRTAPVAPADLNLSAELEALRQRARRETEI